jgi:hypothetical protein
MSLLRLRASFSERCAGCKGLYSGLASPRAKNAGQKFDYIHGPRLAKADLPPQGSGHCRSVEEDRAESTSTGTGRLSFVIVRNHTPH